jgi:type I restriction enzyme S subunit
MGNIRKGGGFNSKGSKDYFDLNSNPKDERYLIKKGDLLMSMTDMKNNVALLGHTALMPVSDEYLVNQRVGLIRKSDKHYLDYPFLYYQTNEPLFITDVRSRANSGVQVNLSTKGIKDTLLVVPPKEIHDAFDKQVRAFLEMIFTNDQQSEELASIRDLLLPKLLSGEIELSAKL